MTDYCPIMFVAYGIEITGHREIAIPYYTSAAGASQNQKGAVRN